MKKLIGLLVGVFVLMSCQQEKIAYVDNDSLQDNFEALKKLNKSFESQQEELQAIWEKDMQEFQQKVQEYQDKLNTLSTADEESERNKLIEEQQNLQQKQQVQQSLMMQQRENKQDSVFDILRDKVKDYAKTHNYAFVFGANNDDNVLYADEAKDITKEIIEELNKDSDK